MTTGLANCGRKMFWARGHEQAGVNPGEGQTEERFVKDVLGPAFWEKGLFFTATILATKRVKDGPNFKGGVTNLARFRNDTRRLFDSAGGALVTTMSIITACHWTSRDEFPATARHTDSARHAR